MIHPEVKALKPCPFCLNELSMARDYDGDPIYTHPDSENCVLSGTSWDADCFDVKAWNTRAHSVSRPAVKVRKLEWVKSEIIGWNGDYHTVPTGYSIRCADENGWKWSVAGGFGYCSSPEAAKAAAQSDFEQRVLSSLSPPNGA